MSASLARVAITDWTFDDLELEKTILLANGVELVTSPGKSEADLISLVADTDAVITQFAKLNSRVIDAMGKARVIVRYGIGVDNVDLAAARDRNIPVCNVPDYCIDEVADHTLAFILSATRQVVVNSNYLHDGKWGLAVPLASMQTLKELTVGVVGFGRIGREVVSRLLAFKCKVLVFDPVVPAADIARTGAQAASLEQLLQQSDKALPR